MSGLQPKKVSKTKSPASPLAKAESRNSQSFIKEPPLTRTTLLRKIYRVLLNKGRTYAAFTEKERDLIESLRDKKEILDPMSGYGSLTRYCAQTGLQSFCLEYNLPQHLWQLLCHPAHSENFIEAIQLLLNKQKYWPVTTVRATVSDEWYTPESQHILLDLLSLTDEAIDKCFGHNENLNYLIAALLLPFVGRLSCSVPGDIVTHVKKGGICVYVNWQADFELYLRALKRHLENIKLMSKSTSHTLAHGDARSYKFPKKRFGAMLTSPPYPNHRDFISMFAPEHAFLDILQMPGSITSRRALEHIIGSNFVSERPERTPMTKVANDFLKAIKNLKRNETAIRHDRQYYVPYFENYFADLEEAYKNVASALKQKFEGYIIVVNNTHRNLLVPVSDTIMEIWQSLDFNAAVFSTTESFHVGTKNPRARGLRARHTEYVIKVWR
jgi:hypothetical protein